MWTAMIVGAPHLFDDQASPFLRSEAVGGIVMAVFFGTLLLMCMTYCLVRFRRRTAEQEALLLQDA